MKNLPNTQNPSPIYEVVLDGIVIRGTFEQVQTAIKEWRENHD